MRRSGSFIGILILLAISGRASRRCTTTSGARGNGDFGDNDFFNSSACRSTTAISRWTTRQIPANASIEIENPRGDVSITASDQPNLEVQAQEVAYANSDSGREEDL